MSNTDNSLLDGLYLVSQTLDGSWRWSVVGGSGFSETHYSTEDAARCAAKAIFLSVPRPANLDKKEKSAEMYEVGHLRSLFG